MAAGKTLRVDVRAMFEHGRAIAVDDPFERRADEQSAESREQDKPHRVELSRDEKEAGDAEGHQREDRDSAKSRQVAADFLEPRRPAMSADVLHDPIVGQHRGPAWLEEVGRDLTAIGGVAVVSLVTLGVAGFLFVSAKVQRDVAGLVRDFQRTGAQRCSNGSSTAIGRSV